MWDGLPTLLLLCLVMGAASFLAGLLPLTFALSQRQLRLITALGTGVLVGTSLIVIIPEGIETLYNAGGGGHSHAEKSMSLAGQRRHIETLPTMDIAWDSKHRRTALSNPLAADQPPPDSHTPFRTGPDDGFDAAAELPNANAPSSDTGHNEGTSLPLQQENGDPSHPNPHHDETEHAHTRDPHAYVGISLMTGFILMYLIDTLPRRRAVSQTPQRTQINLNTFNLSRGHTSPSSPPSSSHPSNPPSSRPTSTTVGLVIHAAADGIALGASSTSTSGLNFIIFIALMIHKAPAAFGLTTVLLKQGLSKRGARAHLSVFSAAAPVGALLTWATAHLLGYGSFSSEDGGGTEFATGVLLLFSAGTFLYVAMHTMQESSAGSGGHEGHGDELDGYAAVESEEGGYGQPGPGTGGKAAEGGMSDVLVCVVGMLLPLLTQFGHVH